MKAILKRLEDLERRRQTSPSNHDAHVILMGRLNAIAERMRASKDWPPEPRPTLEEVKQRFAARSSNRVPGQ